MIKKTENPIINFLIYTIMKKKEAISAIDRIMKDNGLTREELIAYWAQAQEQETVPQNDQEKYPFEVIFTDGSRAWKPQKGKTPWGVIFRCQAICLKNAPELLTWEEAVAYCKEITLRGKVCNAGSPELWIQILSKEAELNEFIKQLGGDELKGHIWTAKEEDRCWANFATFPPKRQSLTAYFKSTKLNARPILPL